jgi:hypothetical protein
VTLGKNSNLVEILLQHIFIFAQWKFKRHFIFILSEHDMFLGSAAFGQKPFNLPSKIYSTSSDQKHLADRHLDQQAFDQKTFGKCIV